MAIISSLEKEQVPEIVKQIYEDFEKTGKKVPEWIKVMAHRPEILKEFYELFKTIMAKGVVSPKLKLSLIHI